MDTAHKRNSPLVIRRLINPRARSYNNTLSMIEPREFHMEPSRPIPLIDIRPISNFTTKDEYVEAVVEDLCDWFNFLYKLENDNQMTPMTFFLQIEDGVILNKHANVVQYVAESYLRSEKIISRSLPLKIGNQIMKVPVNPPTYVNVDFTKKINAFHKRDNVSNFIHWCRNFNIPPGLTFETDDLISLKNPRNVVVCLLEIARIGGLFGLEVPDIIQLDEEIDKELVDDINSNNGNKHIQQDQDFVEAGSDRTFNDANVTIRKKSILPRKLSVDKSYQRCQSDMNDEIQDSKTSRLDRTLKADHSINSLSDLEFQTSGAWNQYLDPGNIKIDNSDNESTTSHGSQYCIPKYKTQKPVGRVKIYDCFDRTNFVRDKKYREKCDMRSLDERVREILSECQCCETFPMKRISEGRYQWGDKKTLIFVRILRNHVMVRVGGGWDTLNNFLRKHDHCRKEKQNAQRQMPTPQIRKALNPGFTCSSNLKVNAQPSSENQGINNRNGVLLNFNVRDANTNETIHNTTKLTNLLSYATSQNFHPNSKSIEDVSLQKSENKENSSKHSRPMSPPIKGPNQVFQPICPSVKGPNHQSQSVCPPVKVPLTDYQEVISPNSSENKTIQSNQKLDKYFSRIPVLKKR